MKNAKVKFLKDFWSFRTGDMVSVEELTPGRAHIIVSRGFGEYVTDKPKTKKRKAPPKPVAEKAVEVPEETRDVRPPAEDKTDDGTDQLWRGKK